MYSRYTTKTLYRFLESAMAESKSISEKVSNRSNWHKGANTPGYKAYQAQHERINAIRAEIRKRIKKN